MFWVPCLKPITSNRMRLPPHQEGEDAALASLSALPALLASPAFLPAPAPAPLSSQLAADAGGTQAAAGLRLCQAGLGALPRVSVRHDSPGSSMEAVVMVLASAIMRDTCPLPVSCAGGPQLWHHRL